VAADQAPPRQDIGSVVLTDRAMYLRWLLLTLLCVALLAVGQMLFKSAANQWRVDGWSWSSVSTLFSPSFVAAMALYAGATILWLAILRVVPLSIAFPVFALSFLFVPVLAHFVWGEPLTARTLLGGAIIVIGVIVSVR
jgi:drug/metabolite transporter (DMT)-like permease